MSEQLKPNCWQRVIMWHRNKRLLTFEETNRKSEFILNDFSSARNLNTYPLTGNFNVEFETQNKTISRVGLSVTNFYEWFQVKYLNLLNQQLNVHHIDWTQAWSGLRGITILRGPIVKAKRQGSLGEEYCNQINSIQQIIWILILDNPNNKLLSKDLYLTKFKHYIKKTVISSFDKQLSNINLPDRSSLCSF